MNLVVRVPRSGPTVGSSRVRGGGGGGGEVEWLYYFLEHISRWPKHVPLICIHCGSQSSIGITENKTICIMVSPDIFVVDIIPSDNYSRLGLSLETM